MAKFCVDRVFQTPLHGHYFFGYFNTPQVSVDDSKLLALKCGFIDRIPDKDDCAEVGYFDLAEPRPQFRRIGLTRAFNWQQGCMLQFCGPDYARNVIYNSFDGKRFVAELVEIDTGRTRILEHPIYAMFSDGRRALTIDFARHYWCRRGYSYGNIVDESKNVPVTPGDGIWHVSLDDGRAERIIAIEDMLAFAPISSMDGATHYLEHMTINPAGTRFAFLHRWKHPSGIHTRLCVADDDGRNIRILNDSGRMSHFFWRDNDRIIGYGGLATRVNRLRKSRALSKSVFRLALPVYRALVKDTSDIAKALTGDSYLEINTVSGRIRPVAHALRAHNGHPTLVPGRNIFVTDIYARAKHNQKPRLYAVDLEADREMLLDELGSIAEFDETPMRCDLHPRVSSSGKLVTIDTMDRGVRGIYAYRVAEPRP